jgi:hypothetical protein
MSSGPIPVTNPQQVLSTFQNGVAEVVRFSGPHRLYRAAGWDANSAQVSAYGSWWVDESVLVAIGNRLTQFERWLPEDLLRRAWPAHYRGAAALCEDWNDMRGMFALDLPPGADLTGLVGIAAPQPQRSTMNPSSRTTPMLAGGAEQVYFKRTQTLNSINPLWVHSIHLW